MRGNRRGQQGEPCQVPIKVKEQCLIQDARNGDLYQLKKKMRNSIFKKLEDVNQRDERNCTALHYAAKNSHLEMMRFLIDKGADVKALDKHGWSVLQYAVRYAKLEAVQLLIDLEADIHHRENKGWNCLHLAARNGHPEKARLLLEYGIDVEERQNQGWNALHLAVRYGQPDTISTLLEYGININADNFGWTALHLSCLNGHTDITSILLNKGASTVAVNQDGLTPLHIARQEDYQRIVAMILEAEFQGQEPPDLPSPPPSPPSAPPLETSNENDDESVALWKDRIKRQLDLILDTESDGTSSEALSSTDNGGVGDGRTLKIQWKTLEEEELELIRQLDSVRLREVNEIKNKIIRKKTEIQNKIARLDKQRNLLQSKIRQLETNLPEIEVESGESIRKEQARISDIESVVRRNSEETRLIQTLVDNRRHVVSDSSDLSNLFKRKTDILAELVTAHHNESSVLNVELERLHNRIKEMEEKTVADSRLVREKIQILEAEISHSVKTKEKLQMEHESNLEKLSEQLERAERRSVVRHVTRNDDGEHQWFGCPVCMCLLKPPLRIFQCPEGHILCEECKENPALVHCPQCRIPLEGMCSRNRALEEVARSYFPMAPSETL